MNSISNELAAGGSGAVKLRSRDVVGHDPLPATLHPFAIGRLAQESGRCSRAAQKRPLEQFRRDNFLKWMRSILIIAVMIPLMVTGVRAEDAPSSNSSPSPGHGPNYPNPQRGPAYPPMHSDEQSPPPFILVLPAPQQRIYPTRPMGRRYPGWRLGPFHTFR